MLLWETKVTPNVLQVEFGHSQRREIGGGRDEASHLGEEAYNNQDRVETIAFWELGDKVGGDDLPWSCGSLIRLEESSWFARESLVPVAGVAGCHIRSDVSSHLRPPVVPRNCQGHSTPNTISV